MKKILKKQEEKSEKNIKKTKNVRRVKKEEWETDNNLDHESLVDSGCPLFF
ncbi:hypothetical protein KKF17_00360 [Patescibacteria group bacterium]|nr:hypothetical protein [Patescibacteria group bacterium]